MYQFSVALGLWVLLPFIMSNKVLELEFRIGTSYQLMSLAGLASL